MNQFLLKDENYKIIYKYNINNNLQILNYKIINILINYNFLNINILKKN